MIIERACIKPSWRCWRIGLMASVLMLVVPMLLQAQQRMLWGRVTDAASGEPLAATVFSQGNNKAAVASSDGYYRLYVPQRQSLVVKFQHVGYQTEVREVALQDSLRLDIRLATAEKTLGEAVVVGRSKLSQLKASALPVSVIGQQQLQGTASNVSDVLARTVGVAVRNTGGVGSASRISLRGLEGKRVGVFVDEKPMSQMSNFVAINDIPTSMVESIEIYKGIVPYKFGGSALGGAVNIVTKEYPPVYFDASYEIASFNTHQLSSVFKRSMPKAGLQFGIGGIYTYAKNNYPMRLHHFGGRTVRRNHDRFNKFIGGMSLKATKWWFDEIELEQIFMKTHQEVQGIDLDVRKAYNHSWNSVTSLALERKDFFLEGLDFDYFAAFSTGRYGLRDTAMQRYDWDGNVLPPVSAYGGEQNAFASDGRNRSSELMSKLNLGLTIDEHHAVNLNASINHTRLNPEDKLMDKALGFQANFPSRMTSATLGLSYDLSLLDGKFRNAFTLKDFFFASHSRSIDVYSITAPQPVDIRKNYIGLSNAMRYAFTPQLMLKASFNAEVRIPTSEELIGNGYSILASPALRPERTTGTNLGLLYRCTKADGGLVEFEVSGFYNLLNDMIRFTPDMIPTMARYRNFGRVRTMGVEVEGKGDVCPWLYVYGNFTYQDLRDVRQTIPGTQVDNPTKGLRIPNVPYLLANVGAELHKENLFGGREQNTRLLLDASYVHQFYYDFEMSKYQERKIPSALTMDAALEHSFGNNRWTLTLKLKNLANKHIVSELNRPLPGRTLALKVRFLLK